MIRAFLLDVEGTTTPVEFVTDVLFPFARANLETFVRALRGTPALREDLAAFRAEHVRERVEPPPSWSDESEEDEVRSLVAYAVWLMDRDRKSTALKSLQGRIWGSGYRSGALRGEVYADVVPALRRWRGRGAKVAIFSSGSVLAQKLLFGHSSEGDLRPLFDAHFDTTTGPKKEKESYDAIAGALGVAAGETLFASDVEGELEAAAAAGMETVLVVRAPRALGTTSHRIARSFDEIE